MVVLRVKCEAVWHDVQLVAAMEQVRQLELQAKHIEGVLTDVS